MNVIQRDASASLFKFNEAKKCGERCEDEAKKCGKRTEDGAKKC